LVLPGIVDIHGDAFERQLQPRPGQLVQEQWFWAWGMAFPFA